MFADKAYTECSKSRKLYFQLTVFGLVRDLIVTRRENLHPNSARLVELWWKVDVDLLFKTWQFSSFFENCIVKRFSVDSKLILKKTTDFSGMIIVSCKGLKNFLESMQN